MQWISAERRFRFQILNGLNWPAQCRQIIDFRHGILEVAQVPLQGKRFQFGR